MTDGPDSLPPSNLGPDSFGSDGFGSDETVGALIGQRFRLDQKIGEGAMGRVYRAFDFLTQSDVAVKVLHKRKVADRELVARFQREAQILGELGHSAIVKIIDFESEPGMRPWLAMELLEGENLKDLLAKRQLSLLEIQGILNTLADGLNSAHSAGVVHRDLKPENIFVLSSGVPACKIVDFGLSRFTKAERLTHSGTVIGTPHYMAPELLYSSEKADSRADVFSVGAILFEMLTGKVVYPAEDMSQLMGCIISGRIRDVREFRPDLPSAVQETIRKSMHVEPKKRFDTVGAVAESFASALGQNSGRSSLRPMLVEYETGIHSDSDGHEPLIEPFDAPSLTQAGLRLDPQKEQHLVPSHPSNPRTFSQVPQKKSAPTPVPEPKWPKRLFAVSLILFALALVTAVIRHTSRHQAVEPVTQQQ